MELCQYGLQITMANMINLLIVLTIGFLFSALPEVTVFYVVFVSIRIFSGGYHANSYGKCFTLFAITCFLYLLMVQEILLYGGNQLLLFFAAIVFLGGMILKKAPIAHANRPLSGEERVRFRKNSILLWVFWSVAGSILWAMQIRTLSAGLISVFIETAVYMLVKEGRKEDEKEEL